LDKRPQSAVGQDANAQQRLRAAGAIPRHIAIIMDGNGRWAKHRGLPRTAGHQEGVESVRDIVEACGQLGVEFLTLYAWSTENWKRPKEEVSLLMRLLLKALRDETDRLHSNNVRLQMVGDSAALPQDVQNELLEDIHKTKANTGLTLTLALSYSGRWDLSQAVRRIAHDVKAAALAETDITESTITRYLTTAHLPDPDLLIRTSGEFRISNFLLWQLAYSEIYITPRFWPAFRRDELYTAITDFQRRERRFGMVSEQLHKQDKSGDLSDQLIEDKTGP
jgi:undecaprenyl diphosphate synthase